ncbi:MAG: ATP-binding cassette domain-containing protein [Anaeroplasmataceae bacterium]|nr:ATP-binding cassette domain-containing protein [Anaeroplasmataceae bacterium]
MDQSIIELADLTKIYKVKKEEILAVEHINLKIEEKDIFGIIGLSGAGKSTLIRCINYLEKPTSGEVFFKGIPLSRLKEKELRKIRQDIGMIFQGFNLLDQRTVLKNILFPLEIAKVPKQEAVKRARELLQLVGLADRENAYPSELSGGQKQRVAIARALANQPSVLLCDEATSALDPNTTRSILELLKDINQKYGITIVIITHEMHVIESICNKVAIIDQSQIKEVGFVNQIFEHPQTSIAKSFILPDLEKWNSSFSNKILKINFEGNVVEPILAKMILETKVLVNILEANVKTKDSKLFGEMLLQLPEDLKQIAKIKHYLDKENIEYEEGIAQ